MLCNGGRSRYGGSINTQNRRKPNAVIAPSICADTVSEGYVRQIINLTQTTSGSYLLMVSLDLARKNLALNGKELFKKAVDYADYAREEINKIGGYYAFGRSLKMVMISSHLTAQSFPFTQEPWDWQVLRSMTFSVTITTFR